VTRWQFSNAGPSTGSTNQSINQTVNYFINRIATNSASAEKAQCNLTPGRICVWYYVIMACAVEISPVFTHAQRKWFKQDGKYPTPVNKISFSSRELGSPNWMTVSEFRQEAHLFLRMRSENMATNSSKCCQIVTISTVLHQINMSWNNSDSRFQIGSGNIVILRMRNDKMV